MSPGIDANAMIAHDKTHPGNNRHTTLEGFMFKRRAGDSSMLTGVPSMHIRFHLEWGHQSTSMINSHWVCGSIVTK